MSLKASGKEQTFSDYTLKYILAWGVEHEQNGVDDFVSSMSTSEANRWEVVKTGIHPVMDGSTSLVGASPDRLLRNKDSKENMAVLEVKCPFNQNLYPSIQDFVDGHGKYDDEIIIKPDHYLQLQLQMKACDVQHGFYICWTPMVTAILGVEFDEKLWIQTIKPLMESFLQATQQYNDKTNTDVKTKSLREKKTTLAAINKSQSWTITLYKLLRVTKTEQ